MRQISILLYFLIFTFHSLLYFSTSAQNNYLNFDGNNDHVILQNDTIYDYSGDFTIELMFKKENLNTRGDLFGKKQLSNASTSSYNIGIYVNNNNRIESYLKGSTNSSSLSLVSSTTIDTNNWFHVACVRTGNVAQLYINGSLEATGNFSIDLTSNGRISIGSNIANSINPNAPITWPFNGSIDEVRFWNISRSQQEINANMNNGLIGNEVGLISYYDFNQGIACGNNPNDTLLIDKTINNKSGQLNNFNLTSSSCTSNWAGSIVSSLDESSNLTELELNLFPNPTNNFLNINLSAKIKEGFIIDMQGSKILNIDPKRNIIDVSSLSVGIYFVFINTGDTFYTKKFIKN